MKLALAEFFLVLVLFSTIAYLVPKDDPTPFPAYRCDKWTGYWQHEKPIGSHVEHHWNENRRPRWYKITVTDYMIVEERMTVGEFVEICQHE